MKPEHLHELWVKRPFHPFRIRLADGSFRDVLHPECLWVTPTLIGISSGLDDPLRGMLKDAALLAPEHIVAAELLQAQST
jgi:hypothetical protein